MLTHTQRLKQELLLLLVMVLHHRRRDGQALDWEPKVWLLLSKDLKLLLGQHLQQTCQLSMCIR